MIGLERQVWRLRIDSASTISLYGGALSDKGGVPPVLGMDANIVVFSLALLLLLVGWLLAREKSA